MSDSPKSESCSCRADETRASSDPAYRRALWIVVSLNLGFGVVEAVGGFFARSQSVKADALDFLGDGSITLVGLLALRWTTQSRSRIALAQGIFLGLLGLGVLGAAGWRALHSIPPEAGLMGGIGVAALLTNLGAAFALLPFRSSAEASVRAIWLFSRNDALASLAVILAAALVAWLDQAWPDLIVAAAIALLFLHSSWHIIRDALADLREPASADCHVSGDIHAGSALKEGK